MLQAGGSWFLERRREEVQAQVSARLVMEDLARAATAIETAFQGGWSLEDRRSLYELQSLLGDEWTAQHRTVLASHLSMKDWMDLAFAVRAASTSLPPRGIGTT
jgi:hypothetical protein